MLEPKAKACPFCGNEWVSLRNAGNNGVLRQAYCRDVDCGARGPTRPSDDHALAAWNNRAGVEQQPASAETQDVKAACSKDVLSITDTDRLNWLEAQQPNTLIVEPGMVTNSLRIAIDEKIKQQRAARDA